MTEPTEEELAAANAVLARKAAADQARIDAAMPALRSLIDDAAFATMLEQAEAARDQLAVGTPLHHHLTAMVVGMVSLKTDVARVTAA